MTDPTWIERNEGRLLRRVWKVFCLATSVGLLITAPSSAHDYGWTQPLALTETTSAMGNDAVGTGPVIAGDGQSLLVVWQDYTAYDEFTTENVEVMARFSQDAGRTWESAQNVSNNSVSDETPAVAMSATSAVVATRIGYNFFVYRYEHGVWQKQFDTTRLEGHFYYGDPLLESNGSNYYLLTTDRNFYYSHDDGKEWTPTDEYFDGVPEDVDLAAMGGDLSQ